MSDNVTDLNTYKVVKAIEDQTGITRENSNLTQAIEEAKERLQLYDAYDSNKERELYERYEIPPQLCENSVCKYYDVVEGCHVCTRESPSPVSCLYRMIQSPPNSMNYKEGYIPTHMEALDMLAENGLLVDDREEYRKASIYYGKARNQKERWNTEIKGIDFNMLQKCIRTSMQKSFDFIKKGKHIDIGEYVDTDVISRNISVEVEKAMGIFPNISIK